MRQIAHSASRALLTLLVAGFAAASLGGCAWLDLKQRQIALRPTPGRPAAFADGTAGLRPGDVRYTVAVPASGQPLGQSSDQHMGPAGVNGEDQLALWWMPHPNPSAPTLLYLHGTLFSLYRNIPKIDALRDAGFAVLAVDYRGWGESTPIIPSEATIAADVQRAWAELVQRAPQAGRRVIFGHSMGGAAAVALASGLHVHTDYGALVLESTFTSLPDVAAEAGFLGRIAAAFTTLRFDSRARIGQVDAPLLMLHGSADKTVPVQLGRRLHSAARPGARWVEVPGGTHSQLHREAPEVYRQAMRSVIAELEAPEIKSETKPETTSAFKPPP